MIESVPEYYHIALKAAREASLAIMEHYSRGVKIITKTDGSPVTEADLNSSHIIEDILLTSNFPIIGEESIEVDYEIRKTWIKCWCVDPLDGTKEFIKKNGEFAVNIALIENHKATFGLIASPVKNEVIFGSKDFGVYYSVLNESENSKNWKRIQATTHLTNPFTVTCSRSHHSGPVLNFLNRVRENHPKIEFLKKGSSLKFFDLALGRADVYPRFARTMEWDIASGQAILEALGGSVVHAYEGTPLFYNKENLANPYFIASSPAYCNSIQ